MVRWGFFGGSFDPPHYGHLRIAEEMGEMLGLERIYFVPSGGNPFKSPPHAPFPERAEMVRRAIALNTRFFFGGWEEGRTPSFTSDTLSRIHEEFPWVRWVLLMGEDTFSDFPTWKDPLKILELGDLAVARRSHESGKKVKELVQAVAHRLELPLRQSGEAWELSLPGGSYARIHLPPTTLLSISSTQIREYLSLGRSCRYLLPPEVEEYLTSHNLYENEANLGVKDRREV